jgi:hypothetical protein
MRITRSKRVHATAAIITALAATAALTLPAHALPASGDPEPAEVLDRADLKVTSLSVTPAGTAWSLSYTVVNSGLLSSVSTTLGLGGGPGTAPSVSIPALAPNTSKSGTVQFTRADCYVFVSATADAGRVVTEMSETNNARNAIGVVPGCPPRYKVSAANFKAIDESGADWTGSDEAFWLFSGVGTTGTGTTRATQVYGSMDSGDTQSFSVVDQCAWGCSPVGSPAPFGIGLSVQLWEQDLGDIDDIWFKTADAFQTAGPIISTTPAPSWVGPAVKAVGEGLELILNWAEDDLIGSQTYAFDATGLASALPNRGTSFTDTRIYSDGDAKYSLTMTVSRIV